LQDTSVAVLFFTVRNFLVHLRECFFVFSFYPENWKLKLVQAQAYSLKKRASSLLWKKATKVFSFKGSAHRKNWWTHIQTLDAEAETTGMTLASAYPPAGTGLVKHSELQTLSQGVIPQVNDEPLVSVLVPEALSWSSLHGLVVGDNSHEVLSPALFLGFSCFSSSSLAFQIHLGSALLHTTSDYETMRKIELDSDSIEEK
jgi:hypothetical protein